MKLEQVNEALRFGQREINSLKKNANNILVSFEYEFTFVPAKYEALQTGEEIEDEEITLHPWANEDGEFDPDIDDIRAHHTWDDELERAIEEEANYQMGEDPFDADGLESDLDALVDALEENGIDTTRSLGSYLGDFWTAAKAPEKDHQAIAAAGQKVDTIFDTILDSELNNTFDNLADDYENAVGRLSELDGFETMSMKGFESNLPDGGSMKAYASVASATNGNQMVFDFFQEMLDNAYERMEEEWLDESSWGTINDFIDGLDDMIEDKDHIGARYRDNAQESAIEMARDSEAAEEIAEDNVRHNMETEFDDQVDSGDYTSSAGSAQRFALVRSLIGNPSNPWGLPSDKLEAVADDPSVTNGVEVTFYAQPINEAIDTMRKMFRLIEQIGSTSDNTAGLHTNVSIRGRDMHVKNINPFRMVMMADQDYLIKNFPVRRFVNRMLPKPNRVDHIMVELGVKHYVEGGLKELVEWSEDNLIKDEKYQTINFLNAMGYMPEDRRRVEFRAPGGSDYHKDPDKVEWHTWRMVHLLDAITSEDFEDKEYYRKVFKYWEKAAMDVMGTSFGKLVNEYRKTGNITPADTAGKIMRNF